MANVIVASISSTEKVTKAYTPVNIAEQTHISGVAFSKRPAKVRRLRKGTVLPCECGYARLAALHLIRSQGVARILLSIRHVMIISIATPAEDTDAIGPAYCGEA